MGVMISAKVGCVPPTLTRSVTHAGNQVLTNMHHHTQQDAQGVARQASAMKMNRVSCGDFLAVVHNMVHSATPAPLLTNSQRC